MVKLESHNFIVLGVFVLALFMFTCKKDAILEPEKLVGRITFTAVVNDERRIFVMNADGSGLDILDIQPEICPEELCWYLEPAWSPDGSQITFFLITPFVEDLGPPIYIMNADGTNVRELYAFGLHPDWSPNGSKIVFKRNKGAAELSVINTDSTGLFTINPDGRHPAWSPDGRKIAFVSGPNLPSMAPRMTHALPRHVGDIYVVNLAGTELRRLTNHSGTDDTHPTGGNETPSWSPDGSKIAFSHFDGASSPPSDIWVMNPDGTEQKRLTDYSEKDEFAFYPTWSPDGSKIAFIGPNGIHIMNADGSQETVIFRERSEGEFEYGISSPDWN